MFVFRKLAVVVVVAVFFLAACGNSNDVTITLTDFGIESSRTTFEVGVPYHFVVTNNGVINHEIMLMSPMPDGELGMDMEEMDAMALAMIEEDELTPGTTMSFDYTFTEPAPAGTLEFACHVEGHYDAGMKLAVTVK